MNGVEMREAYVHGELSPVEVVRETLEQIEALEPRLNAFVTVTADLAMEQAHAAERLYLRQRGQTPLSHPLAGIPITIKDLAGVRGVPTSHGSLLHQGEVAKADAPFVARVREAGAVILGKTATPEFGWKGETSSRVHGTSHNPWRHDRTPGGSSGGAAAALAAGLGPLAQGGDGAGSIRIPAAFCGVLGLKTTRGLIPRTPPSGSGLSVVGPMTRTVPDAALLLDVVAGTDAWAGLEQGVHGLRIAWSGDLGYAAIEAPVGEACEAAALRFTELGAEVVEEHPALDDPWPALDTIWAANQAADHAADFDAIRDRLDRGRAALVERGLRIPASEYVVAQDVRAGFEMAWDTFMEGFDLMLTPTVPITAFAAGLDHPGPSRADRASTWAGRPSPTRSTSPASPPPPYHAAASTACRWGCRSWAAGARTLSSCAQRGRTSFVRPGHMTTSTWDEARMTRRWREIGGPVGLLPIGRRNSITDVPGVLVGHAQASSGEQTGITVIAPPSLPARAGVATVNGVGELTKKLEIDEWGIIQTAIYLCGTHAVGTVYHAAVMLEDGRPDNTLIPVVGECDDSDLGDSRTIVTADVQKARASLSTEVAEGSVGSGTGMTCFDFAGGIGTSSRRVGEHTLGVLLMCNFGDRERLMAGGVRFEPAEGPPPPEGSCIAVCATDAPVSALQLRRLALRPLLGLARSGSYAANGSGEIGLAFTTTDQQTMPNSELNPFFAAAYEAAEEAVYNCLVAERPPMRKRDGREHPVFPRERLDR